MSTEITIAVAAVLLVSQVAVVIALAVLFKKFKALKDELNRNKIKNNRDSLPMLIVKETTDENNRPSNEYVDGQRHPSTLVKYNSQESIVYVPTPAPERRSKNYDEEASYGIKAVVGSSDDPVTPHIEDMSINAGYDREPDEEIYGNQVAIDMMEKGGAVTESCDTSVTLDNVGGSSVNHITSKKESSCSGLSLDNHGSSVKKVAKSKKRKSSKLCEYKKVVKKQEEIVFQNETTSNSDERNWCEGHNAEDITEDVTQQPIYENLRESNT